MGRFNHEHGIRKAGNDAIPFWKILRLEFVNAFEFSEQSAKPQSSSLLLRGCCPG